MSNLYRPEIDGLRAISIIAVIVFHAFPNLLPGGFIGVDVFFVISGYLVTSIILKGIKNSTFNLFSFFKRRILRIFPALLVVIGFTLAMGTFLLTSLELRKLSEHAIASLLLVQNLLLATENGYFDVNSNLKPLLHLWSLSVEEQFYLFIPTLVLFAFHFKLDKKIFFLGLLLAFFIYGLVTSDAYFSSLVRFWEILLGSVAASTSKLSTVNISSRSKNMLQWLGLSLIGVSCFIATKHNFPGYQAILPTSGTVLFLVFTTPTSRANFLLSFRPLVYVGKISYPLYLWHWPLLSFMHILNENHIGTKIALIATSFAFAAITYEYVEKPVKSFFMRESSNIKWLWITTVSVLTLSLFITYSDGLPNRHPASNEVVQAQKDWTYPGDMKSNNENGVFYYSINSKTSDTILFVGDSNMEQYYPRVNRIINSNSDISRSAFFVTAGGCNPLPNYKHNDASKHCNDILYRNMMELLDTKSEIDTVVISALWSSYIRNDEDTFEQISTLKKISLSLQRRARLIVILEMPTSISFAPEGVIKRSLRTPSLFNIENAPVHIDALPARYTNFRKKMQEALKETNTFVIDPQKHLCPNNFCNPVDENLKLKYKDATHLRASFTANQVTYLDSLLFLKHDGQVSN